MANWTKAEVVRIVTEALTPVVAAAGFQFRKRSQTFVRKINGGRQEFGLPLVDHDPVFEFSFTLCIRLEAVQEITNRFSDSPPKYHRGTLTSITQLEFLGLPAQQGRGVIYRVDSESELEAILPSVLEMVRLRVLPFFDEYKHIEAVNRGLNPIGAEHTFQAVWPPDRCAFDATNQPYRSITGVAVAHLAGDARLSDLIAAYRAQIQEAQESDRRKFENLVGYLLGQTTTEKQSPLTK